MKYWVRHKTPEALLTSAEAQLRAVGEPIKKRLIPALTSMQDILSVKNVFSPSARIEYGRFVQPWRHRGYNRKLQWGTCHFCIRSVTIVTAWWTHQDGEGTHGLKWITRMSSIIMGNIFIQVPSLEANYQFSLPFLDYNIRFPPSVFTFWSTSSELLTDLNVQNWCHFCWTQGKKKKSGIQSV